MGRKGEQNPNGSSNKGRVKAYVFGFELEGSDDVLAEGIKAFTAAMSRSGVVLSHAVLAQPKPAAPQLGTTTPVQPGDTFQEEPNGDVAVETEEIENPVEKGSPNNSASKRQYNYNPPNFLNDLDLTKATKQLSEFIAEKGSPKEMNDRYIAIAAWLKEYMNLEEFTIDHIYTAFNSLGWKAQMPINHSQPLRDLKTKRHFLTKEKGSGYKVNWQGTQYVAKMGSTSS